MYNNEISGRSIFAVPMKKFFVLLFSVFYFGLSSGAVLAVHYCMDELVSVSQHNDDACTKCGALNKKDCCKTEFKVLKTDPSPKVGLLELSFSPFMAETVRHYDEFRDISFSALRFSGTEINAPPENKAVPIFIKYCNFRI